MARRKSPRKKRIPMALFLSLAAHAAILFALLYFARTTVVTKKGSISVDFIETVRHDSSKPIFRGQPTVLQKTPVTDPVPTQPLPPISAGDPAARVRETDAYIQAVLEIINRRKTYPKDSLDREEEGRVVIGVSVAADGKIIDVRIEEPSPFTRLDQAALSTVSNISTFPPLPEVVEAPLHLHIPLLYRMENR